MLTALAGLTWGGGAESVMERLLETSDIIVRYQGGGAPHTLRTEDGSYRFRVLPEGLKYPGKVCVLGDGMVIDLDCLRHEIAGGECRMDCCLFEVDEKTGRTTSIQRMQIL